jgi:hypothetical protein
MNTMMPALSSATGQALAYTTPLLAELGKKTDAINQPKKKLAEKNVTDVALDA